MENMTSTQLAQLLYVAYYGRPADASGLTFWAEQIDAVGVEGVAADFGASAEFEARFGDLTNEELVQNLYQQLFGRDGEQAGVDYWVNLLENGTPLAQIALEIANGAQNADITAINNKVAVAQRFTEAAGDDYAGDDAANIARDFLLTVNADTDAETADVEGALDSVADLTTFTLAEAQAAEALPAKYTIEDSAANLVAAASAAAITTLANAEAIVVAGDATVEQMNALINVSEYSNIESYTLNDTVENLLAGGDIVANAASATVAGEPVLTVAQYNEIAAVATVETYTVVDTAEAILEAGADAAALANAGSVAITDEAVTLEQAVALDALSLDVAYPAVDVSLEAAAAADTLPANYALTADVFAAGEVTVEEAAAAFGAVSAIVEGAANAEELAVADLFTWSIADTLENIDAADAAVIEGADAYTLTNEAGDLGELTGEQYELVLGAANADAYTYTVVPSPITGISAQGPVVEGNDIAFTVEMDYAVNVERVISYQIEGATTGTAGAADALADLGQITGTVTIPAGETTGTITLTPLEDGTTEGREAFTVSLLNEDGTEVVATSNVVVIEDNANAGRNITLSDSVDTIEPSAGNDTVTGTIVDDGNGNPVAGTLSTLDSINTGANSYDILRINDISNAVDVNAGIAGLQIQNVNEFQIRSANDFTLDSTGFAGTELLNVLQGNNITLTAAEDTAIQVAGIQKGGAVTLTDGSTQTIDLTREDIDVDVEGAAGAVSVTSADQGTGNIAIDGGTDVTVEATADQDTTGGTSGTIQVGQGGTATDLPSGAINVTQNLNSDGTTTDLQGGDITTTGGTTVDITVNANSVAEADNSNNDIQVGAISVTGGDSTTDVTVTQNDNAETFTSEEVAEVLATQTLTFKALKAGQTTTVDGLTFTASEDLTAEQVAAAFANLTSADTQSSGGPVENGIFTGALGTAGWTSGAANGANVVFTAPAHNSTALTVTGGDVDPTSSLQTGTAASGGVESSNAVAYGAVTVTDGGVDSITNVTLDGYANGSTIAADALETLNIANSAVGADLEVATAATVLTANVDGVTSSAGDTAVVNLDSDGANGGTFNDNDDATVTDLTLNAAGNASTFILEASAVKNLTIDAAAALDIGNANSTFDSVNLETVDVNGAGSVDLGDITAATALNSFNAADNMGGVTATVDANAANVGDIEEYVFSAGNDTVALNDTTVDVAVTLGAGDDSVTLASGTTALGAMVDGGEGTDTLVMAAADAVNASAGTAFEQNIQGFERLSLGQASADGTVDLANMDDINYVRTAGTTGIDQRAVYTLDFTGLVLNFDTANGGDTFSIGGQVVYTATTDGEGPSDAASAINGDTVTIGGVVYDIDASDATAVTLTAQSSADVTGTIDMTVNNVSTDGAATAPGTATNIAPTTNGVDGELLTLDNLSNDAIVELTANGSVEAVLADATGTADSLNVIVSTNTADVNAGTLTVADVETVNITSSDNQLDNDNDGTDDAVETNTLDLNADSATSVVVDGNANLVLDVADSADVTTIDAGALTGALTVTATGDAAMTVNGGSGADNLTAAGNGDVLNGGAGNDTLTGANLSQLTGGEGADTFVMNTPSNVNSYSTILDLEAGDVIDLSNVTSTGQSFVSSAVTLADTAVFQDFANAAINQLAADDEDFAWFQFGGNTFIVGNDDQTDGTNVNFENGVDSIIQIAGEVDLSLASYNQTNGTLEIA